MSPDTPQARLLAALVEYRAASAARSWIGVVDLMDHHQRREQRFCDAANELLAAALVPADELAALDQPAASTKPFQSCHCPAVVGEDCPLTMDECDARTADYIGMPWFGARLRRIWDGFVSESMNGVVCSIPDTGLNTPAHRTWCLRCQRRYMELKTLVEMLESRQQVAALDQTAPPSPQSDGRLREVLEKWIGHSHLQTFEDRQRFRAEAKAALAHDAPPAEAPQEQP